MGTDLTLRTLELPPVRGGDDGGGLDPKIMAIRMAPIGSVHGAQPGVGVTVTGTWDSDFPGPYTLFVTADGIAYPAVLDQTQWRATIRFYRTRTASVSARITDSS